MAIISLGGRFDFFFCWGRGKGESEALGGGGDVIENPRVGGLQEGEEPRGQEGVCGELGNFFWGGGLNISFGSETSTKLSD